MKTTGSLRARLCVLVSLSLLALPIASLAQTRVVAPKNPYNEAKDVELGRQAAQQAERQLPLLHDQGAQDYVNELAGGWSKRFPPNFSIRNFITLSKFWTFAI